MADLQYTPYAGGGELTLSLLSSAGGTVEIGISGFNDFRDLIEAGQLRVLAVVSPEPLEGVDAPTMIELGYPEVDLVTWRGIVAAPGISDQERAELEEIVQEMVEAETWAEAIDRNRWVENLAPTTPRRPGSGPGSRAAPWSSPWCSLRWVSSSSSATRR